MDSDREYRAGRVPLPGLGESGPAYPVGQSAASGRRDGIRHARRVSNWTAAALIVAAGAATVALAHQAIPAAAPAGTASRHHRDGDGGYGAGQPGRRRLTRSRQRAVGCNGDDHDPDGQRQDRRHYIRHVPAYQDN